MKNWRNGLCRQFSRLTRRCFCLRPGKARSSAPPNRRSCASCGKFLLIEITSRMGRSSHAHGLTRCCTIPRKPRSECSECCAKAWFVRSKEKMSKSKRKQFAFTETRPAPSSLHDLFAQAWKKTAFRFKHPGPRHEYLFW